MTETVRLRVEFKDRHILSKSQSTDGLRRSWILLKPQHRTISDLAAYLLHVFDLHDSCPDGLLISMDEFVLPPFESTCIFKDRDIVSVKRKGVSEVDMIEDGRNCIEVEEIVERQLVNGGMKLLANEEFEKEKGGYESELEEDEPDQLEDILPVKNALDNDTSTLSKKRKRSNKPESSKKKRSKSATTGGCSVVPEDVQGDVQEDKNRSSRKRRLRKSLSKKEKSTTGEGGLDDSSTSETDKRTNNISHSTPSANRHSQLQENGINGVVSSDKPDESKKLPSRSARRKKAKRIWKRENMKAQKEELHQTQVGKPVNQQSSDKDNQKSSNKADQQSSDKANQQLSDKDNQKSSEEDEPNTDNDEEDNVVPVVTRPGHIRFAPLGKVEADQSFQQNEIPVKTFQWNGITSKKKGQKWGMEKTSYSNKSNYEDLYQESSKMPGIEEEIPENYSIDFNKLELSTSVPKEGDLIAYRLIELSSCWTPEVSSYRVGKVSRYNLQSNKIVLVQVPEYPIVFEETDEESEVQPDTSLYGEDGSLEIDYSSLIDVRIVKYGNLNTAKAVTGDQNDVSSFRLKNGTETRALSGFRLKNVKETQAAALGFRLKNDKGTQAAASGFSIKNDKETRASAQENGKAGAWDEISQALNAKKAELSQEEGWGKNDGSGSSSWTSRPWRGSALGPTMALLRAQSEL
ncbi:coilin isoform X2 [Rosa chinensis]|uniref:coilin isoform X2 n=1 Tax=Rosa chinensis TaxID=74649 RepID=UPI000D095953|nr:coilin isoform X2 [Rosa chinensis]